MPFVIRTAVEADLDDLRGIFRRASLSNVGDRANLQAHPEVLELSGDAVGEGRTRVAVGPDGSVLGFSSFLVGDGFLDVEDLFVDPPSMRLGIARALILDLRAIASSRSIGRLEVTANPHALAFYEATGFVAIGVVETRFAPAPRLGLQVS